MANVAFSNLHDQVLPYLPGAEKGIVDFQIRKVVREFMKRTTIIRETFTFNTVGGASTYLLTPASPDFQVSSIIAVWVDGKLVDPIPEDKRLRAASGPPKGWWTSIPHLLNIYPQPDAGYAVEVNAALSLTQTATLMPEELIAQYAEAIAAGTLATMMGMPGKPWTQSQSAKEAGRTFAGVIKTIRGNLRDGGQPNQSTFQAARRFGV